MHTFHTNSFLKWGEKVRPTPFSCKGFLWVLVFLALLSLTFGRLPAARAGAQVFTYTVQPGDTLWGIARQYGLSVRALVACNEITDADRIYPGQVLQIPQVRGVVVHTIARGDTLWGLSRRYGVSVEALCRANPGVEPRRLIPGKTLLVPAARRDRQAPGRGSLTLSWPLRGPISSPFGPRLEGFHYGLDIAAPRGTSIKAARSGRVVECGWKGSYGRTVVIDHGGGLVTLYAHASRLLVQPGQWVKQGEVIALVGSSGRSTGPHLHFEVRIAGQPVDPRRYLR